VGASEYPESMRAELLRQLRALPPPDSERQVDARRRLVMALHRHDPFDRRRQAHVTASAIVVGPRGVLLHRHKRLRIWLQPGGHVDAGEAPWTAATREVLEETGIRACCLRLCHVDVHPGPCRAGAVHLDLRYLFRGDGEPRPAPGESPEAAWFAWPAALELADEGLRAALLAALAISG
jgi:8-oxo-dGTP pyrophosphatase MutT (NUDIX family)